MSMGGGKGGRSGAEFRVNWSIWGSGGKYFEEGDMQ